MAVITRYFAQNGSFRTNCVKFTELLEPTESNFQQNMVSGWRRALSLRQLSFLLTLSLRVVSPHIWQWS